MNPDGEMTIQPLQTLGSEDHVSSILQDAAVCLPHAPVWSPDPHWKELSASSSCIQLCGSICSKVEFCRKLNTEAPKGVETCI